MPDQSLLHCLKDQLERYPCAQTADLMKLLYQNEFGCGHLIADPAQSFQLLCQEVAGQEKKKEQTDSVEPIGNGLCRLHLNAQRQGLSLNTLHRLFLLCANEPRGTKEGFLQKAGLLEQLCAAGKIPLSTLEVRRFIETWLLEGCRPFRHSQVFREHYAPAYRVTEERFCRFLPLFCRMDEILAKKGRVLVAVEGRCGAGKTSLASLLKEVYRCNVIPMDHFFLRPDQRTPTRLAEPGGNVDYERFREEVLMPLKKAEAFSYRPYDCSKGVLAEPVTVPLETVNIVEGSYSLHPALAAGYDLKVFLSVDAEEQMRRIRIRNGERMAARFEQEWIPLEERYFEELKIHERCDLRFD